MELKKNLDITSDDFYYDLFDGGYITPREICKNLEDVKKIEEAIEIIKDFKESCEEQIEGFIQ
jgi:hypothetical protein